VRVAPEELVGALAREHHLDALPARELADEVERQAHRVGQRLVLVVDQLVEDSQGVAFGDRDLVVVGPEVLGDAGGLLPLVELGMIGEADRERGQAAGALAQQCDEGGRVEPAAQQHADRDVAEQPLVDGALERLAHGCGRVGRRRVGERARLRHVPVAPDRDAGGVAGGDRPGGELVDSRVQGVRARHDQVRQVGGQRALVDARHDRRVREQRLDLRGEQQAPVDVRPVQRLLAQPVTAQQQPAVARIPEREREHAVQVVHEGLPAPFVEVQDHLGVARRPERRALALQIASQGGVVVDLAVEDEARPACPEHRLRAALEVEDRQPPVGQADPPVRRDEDPLAVGPAVAQRLAHRQQDAIVDRAGRPAVLEDAGEPAHD
jgi:hypothetical protein